MRANAGAAVSVAGRVMIAGIVTVVLPACAAPTDTARFPAGGMTSPITADSAAAAWVDEDTYPTAAPAVPTWGAEDCTLAAAFAASAMAAFTNSDIDPRTWWEELAAWLTPTAQVAYAGTDPSRVPASAVTGTPACSETASPYLASVEVPTDAGLYTVLLVRDGASTEWHVERLTPPNPTAHLPATPATPTAPDTGSRAGKQTPS